MARAAMELPDTKATTFPRRYKATHPHRGATFRSGDDSL